MIRLAASLGLFAVGFGSLASLHLASANPASEELATSGVRGADAKASEETTPVAPPLPRFLSSASLETGHPFRALESLRARQKGLEAESERLQEARKTTHAELREAQKAAEAAVQQMLADGVAEARAYLADKQEQLLAIVDAGLGEPQTAGLHNLRLDLQEVLPAEAIEANGLALAALIESLEGEILERSSVPDVEAHRTVRRSLKRTAKLARQLIDERVLRPGEESVERLPGQEKRLGPEHDQRMDWVTQSVAETRGHVRERIECAVRRTMDEFEKQLQRRLRNMDVPAPGETLAALEDVTDQLEAWTLRFVDGTQSALGTYRSELTLRAEVLRPALQAHLQASTQATAKLGESVQAALDQHLASPVPVADDWRSREKARQQIERLERGLRLAVAQGRNAMRPAALGTTRALADEEVIAEHAWSDLRAVLRSLHLEASNDCWKLDGPHLDGRFPRPSTESERKDKVAQVTD